MQRKNVDDRLNASNQTKSEIHEKLEHFQKLAPFNLKSKLNWFSFYIKLLTNSLLQNCLQFFH